MGIDRGEYSVALLEKIVYAGVTNTSFEQGRQDLLKLAEVDVSTKQVERVCHRIGAERLAERAQAVSAYEALPLVERKATPSGVTAPPTGNVAVVSCDGGRLQILDRGGRAIEAEEADAEQGRSGKHWREDKIGLLMTMTSAELASDPCPEIPASFVDPARILKLARELKTKTSARAEAAQESATPEAGLEALTNPPINPPIDPPPINPLIDPPIDPSIDAKPPWTPPEVLEKRLVGSRVRWPDFGPILAQSAWSWGFFGASRKAFVADGSDNNWALWRRHFASFEPILDFIHALSYVFASATAGRAFVDGWRTYQEWIGWTWAGDVGRVIEALQVRQAELGEPLPEEGETHPRQVVARSLCYLKNHQSQMKYAEYRRRGLPITSSYVESAVKQFNRRVKGTEKFWSERGAEAILQLRADYLSDHSPLDRFWQTRQETQTGQRSYQMAA